MSEDILEESIFLNEPTKIYEIKTISELKGLSNKFLVRILNGDKTFAWKAEDLDHYHARKILEPYISNINDYEGFSLDKDIVIPSLLKYGEKSLNEFIKKFFNSTEKIDFGYKITWK